MKCKCDEVKKLLLETQQAIDNMEVTADGVIDADMIKTHKSMFYEKVKKIFGGSKLARKD